MSWFHLRMVSLIYHVLFSGLFSHFRGALRPTFAGGLEPWVPVMPRPWDDPPRGCSRASVTVHGFGHPLSLSAAYASFTCVYSICSCPSPSCLTLHESLFDFNNLYVPVMPRYVFIVQTFALSSDPWIWPQLGISVSQDFQASVLKMAFVLIPLTNCFASVVSISMTSTSDSSWLLLFPHPAPLLTPCIQSITKFPPPKDFWGQFIALSVCPPQVQHYHLPQCAIVTRLLTHLPALAMPPLDPSPTPESEFSKTPTLFHLHTHFQPFCLQKSPHSWRWLTRLTPAASHVLFHCISHALDHMELFL